MAVKKGAGGGGGGEDLKTDPCTVFVRNLPYNLTDEQLEEAFGEVGPTRKCFIVKQKGADGEARSRGFAFVQFALKEDADRAVTDKNGAKLLGRVLAVSSAKQRVPLEQRKTPLAERQGKKDMAMDKVQGVPSKATGMTGSISPPVLSSNAAPPVVSRDNTLERHRPNRQVVVGGLVEDNVKTGGVPKKLALLVARKAGLMESVVAPAPAEQLARHKVMADGCPDGLTMLLTYTSVKDARAAVTKLHGATKFKGKSSGALWARQLGGEGALLKRWRVIVRNLSFQVTEEQLRAAFTQAAFVWDVLLPKGADDKPKGFAFLTFTCRADAEHAITKINGTEVCGRPVAVDWALSKKDYEAKAAEEEPAEKSKPKEKAAAARAGLSDDDEDSDSDSDADFDVQESSSEEEEEEGQGQGQGEKKRARAQVSAAETDMLSRIMGNVLGEGQSSEEEEEDGGQTKPTKKDECTKAAQKADEKAKKGEEGKKGKQTDIKAVAHMGRVTEKPKDDGHDDYNAEARTVFVRNVPADATQQLMREKLSKYGRIRACRLVRDSTTGRLKGTAFVEYADARSVVMAVAASEGKATAGGGVWVAAQRLVLAPALTQTDARSLASKLRGGKGGKDSRNLYLAKEGEIDPDSPAAEGLSKLDLQRRAASKKEKELKLKSPNFFVSTTRLSVHNLPLKTDEKALKKIFLDAVKRRATKEQPVVKQAKVLRDKERKGEDGNLRSKGMGFVEFTEHAHAIAALRELNNNPSVFSKDRRPIVEFAIEDVKILKLREKRARLMAAQSAPKEGKEGGEEGKDKSGHKKRAVEKSDGVRGGTDGGKRQCTADRGEEKTAEGKGKYKMGSKERKRLREMRDAQGDGDNGGEQGAAKRCKATKEERKPTASKGTAKGNQKHASAKAAAAIQVSRHVKKGSKEAAEEGKLDGLVADYRAKYDLGGVKAKPNAKAVPQERGRWFE